MGTDSEKSKGWTPTVKGALITATATLVAAAVTGAVLIYNANKSPSSGRSVVATQPGSPSSPERSSPSTQTSTSEIETGLQYLSDLDPVSNNYDAKTGSAEIDQEVYPHSTWVAVGGCSESNHEIEYDVDQGVEVFTAWIGLNKESATGFVVHFQAYVDDVPYGAGSTKKAFEPAERMDVPVSGKHRIKLTATWVSGKPCRVSSVVGYATWGDAQLVR